MRAFAEQEMRFRRVFHYPPYTRMIPGVTAWDSNREAVEREIGELATRRLDPQIWVRVESVFMAPPPLRSSA